MSWNDWREMQHRLELVAFAAYWHRIKHPGGEQVDVETLADEEDDFGDVRRVLGHERDLWGRPMRTSFVPEPDGCGRHVVISSDGPDGQPGTDDDLRFGTFGWQ